MVRDGVDPVRIASSLRVLALAMALLVSGSAALGDTPAPAVATVVLFTIAKSQNKNQVQYAVGVDAHCAPASASPVLAYWLMLEASPTHTEPLLPREISGYGMASQSVTERGAEGGTVVVRLRAMPDRPIRVETWRGTDGACHALSTVTIAGEPAHLFNVYAHIRWLIDVDYLLLRGWSLDGSREVRERAER
jgi:hypothetical protein